MLTVSQLSKSFAGRALFDDVSLQLNRGDRIGLVGPNSAGKSTLFALLLGDVSPDNGTIAIAFSLPASRYWMLSMRAVKHVCPGSRSYLRCAFYWLRAGLFARSILVVVGNC
jgi:ABC-type multidrug transport system ATPase subunit